MSQLAQYYWIGRIEDGFPNGLWRRVSFSRTNQILATVDIYDTFGKYIGKGLSNLEAAEKLARTLGGIVHVGPRAPLDKDFEKLQGEMHEKSLDHTNRN